ncbi:hypothetical protein B0H10DRAFT_639739 [Mycena sp. CBHHK59/15]|nr:hypothetical protein B0H10DRAFT_639739 [Mycena sp. CBHHK59/15]
MPVGYTIKFNWPEEDDKVSAKSDRMIAQVWLQMVKNNTNIAALTNYSSIVFFVRKDQTLYMSGEYLRNMRMPLAIYAFMAYALGKIPKSLLRLPTVTDDWWEVKNHKVETTNTPGVDVG